MIICVSTNPAIDRRLRVKNIEIGEVNRAMSAKSFAGGKAAHVAMAAKALGEEVVWVGFLGGATGDELERQLRGLNIRVVAVRTSSPTRVNDEIIDENEIITEILEPGGPVTTDEIDQLQAACKTLMADAVQDFVMILSGSLPPNVSSDHYAKMVQLAREYGGSTILDASGEALLAGIAACPDLIKPNREEAEKAAGSDIKDEVGAIAAAELFRGLGAKSVAISLGVDGVAWSGSDVSFIAVPPKVKVVSTVGCGDATVAGFAVARLRNLSIDETLKLAVACGAANCLAKLPGQINIEDVRRLKPLVKIRSIAINDRSDTIAVISEMGIAN